MSNFGSSNILESYILIIEALINKALLNNGKNFLRYKTTQIRDS